MSERKSNFTRRRFIQVGGMAGAGTMLPWNSVILRNAFAQAIGVTQGVPLPGNKIPQFVDPLPDLGNGLHVITANANQIVLNMTEFRFPVMPTTFLPGIYQGTYVWGYREDGQKATSYIGPVILATRQVPTEIKYVNNLGMATTTQVAAWKTSTDQTLDWADPLGDMTNPPLTTNYLGPIPAVPHLHGGEVPPDLDGGPDAWFTSVIDANNQFHVGHAYYSKDNLTPKNYAIYRYPNEQEHSNIWFHDHALGITRLNVYAGLAGGYLIQDPSAWKPGAGAPKPDLIPLVIQDRMFDVNGQLYFPNLGINPEHPFWIPEFVGDTIVVNGKVWPYKAVARKRYSLLFLNGSNARAYDVDLIDQVTSVKGPPMYVITTDGGYLDNPVLIDPNTANKAVSKSLVFMPGERYEVIVDFNDPGWIARITAAYPGGLPLTLNLILRNTAKTPYPGGAPAPSKTTGRIMQFRVNMATPAIDTSFNPSGPAQLRNSSIVRLVNPATGSQAVLPDVTRQLTLNEVMGPGGPIEILVNNTRYNGLSSETDLFAAGGIPGARPDFTLKVADTWYSELPKEGETELWEIINLTADAHPIHLHLVQFQLMNRQTFDVAGYNTAYNALFPPSVAIDPMTGLPYPGGVYIGGFGPPAHYSTGVPFNGSTVPVTTFQGGNPDFTLFLAQKKGVQILTPPLPHEAGWKDTVIMYPGQVTRIMVRWAPTDVVAGATGSFPFSPDGGHGYVWHCHIIDHEDNEMMRPNSVDPIGSDTNPGTVTRTFTKGDY